MFGNVVGNLTQGELVAALGRLIVAVGEKMHSGEFSDEDGASLSEIFALATGFTGDVFKEYQDTD